MAAEELNGEVVTDPGERPAPPERPRGADGKFAARASFDDAVGALIDQANGDEPVAEPEPLPADDASQPVESAPVASEGPSEDLRTVAMLAGVEDYLIGAAKDDAQLRAFIAAKASQKSTPAPQAPEPMRREPAAPEESEPLAKVLFAEDEFPSDDPHRQQAKHLADAVNAVAEYFGREISELRESFEKQGATLAQSSEQKAQAEFDRLADELAHPMLGKRSDIAGRGQAEFIAREATYHKFAKLQADFPDADPNVLMESAFRLAFPKARTTNNNQAKLDAIARQSAARLGGDPAPPAREPALPTGTRFDQALQSYLRRR